MADLPRTHPAVLAALNAETCRARTRIDAYAEDHITEMRAALTAAIPHLTADDLPARLVRDIQVRTLRAAARAATYDEGGIPGDHYWNLATVSAWLDGLADNIEGEADHGRA